jgi:arylsulfatase A-like enzyme
MKHRPIVEWINKYDSNMRYADWVVSEVERLLKESGELDNTVLVVTADHGESFGEHGYLGHGDPIHDEVAHIPLIIRFPSGAKTGRITALTQTVDLLPTFCDLFGVPYPPESVQGRSLLPLIEGKQDKVHDYVLTWAKKNGGLPDDSEKYMIRNSRYAMLLYGNGKWRALYDMQADPGQRRNIIAEQPAVAKTMLDAFRTFAGTQRRPPLNFLDPNAKMAPLPKVQRPALTDREKKDLHALGYL